MSFEEQSPTNALVIAMVQRMRPLPYPTRCLPHATMAWMTVLIDEARWPYRDRKWCHMVSDDNLDELHELADAIGIPRRGFQGDHYDVPEDWRPAAIAAGAVVVESRELVRRLRAAGLRLSPEQRRARTNS